MESKGMKKGVSLLLSLLLLLVCAPIAAFASAPVEIATAEDFTSFVNGSPEADAVLTADIELGEWTTAFADGFSGTLDGAGHSVTYTKTNPTGNFHALIKTLNAGGAIRNLTVRGSMTFNAARSNNAPFVYENRGTIENCVNKMPITYVGTKLCRYVGGIAAKNYGEIVNCVNNADISVQNYAGGIVYQNLGGTIRGCVNNGNITATNAAGYAGGIAAAVGANGPEDADLFENCVNTGSITGGSGDYGYAGGIAAQINIPSSAITYTAQPSVTIRGCSSSGTLTAGGGTDEFVARNNNAGTVDPVIEAGIPAHVHDYGVGVVTKEASCGEDGAITYTCATCDEGTEGHSYTETISATGAHTPGEWTEETIDGEALLVKRCTVCRTLLARKSAAAARTLELAVKALNDSMFRLAPVYGKDTNVREMLETALASLGYDTVRVTAVSAENPADGTAAVEPDGGIRYFYADPGSSRFLWFASVPVAFTLRLEDADVVYEKNAVIKWDLDRAAQAVETQIAARVTEEAIKGENEALAAATTDLVLPRAVQNADGEKVLWSLISWESSDPAALSIDDAAQGSADTLFEPFAGVVKRGIEDRSVTLTATFSFQRTSYDEAPVTVQKTFDVTVKGMGEEIVAEMQRQLDENYLAEKLTYIGAKTPVDPAAVTDDVQLLLPRASGIENPNDYTFTVTSDSPNAQVNTARLNVIRPLPGEAPVEATLTVTMRHKDYNDFAAQKEIRLTIAPMEQAELDARVALMEQVKASLFEGLNDGANESPARVTADLSSFIEVVPDGNGGLIWVRNIREDTQSGVRAVSVDPARPSEQWDRFRSSDPAVIAHETLLVTPGKADEDVTITVCLSDARFARYAELYPENETFAALANQIAEVTVTVPGTAPAETQTVEPDGPQGDVCALCGKTHDGFFGKLVGFFHRIMLAVRGLFEGPASC